MKVHLVVVGKLKDKNLLSLENEYFKRINKWKVQIHELKSLSENVDAEGSQILKKVESLGCLNNLFLLSEWGVEHHSVEFANWIDKISGDLCLIIGGAAGFSSEMKEKSKGMISLSKLTFPHQMARVIFIEQLYRAQTIIDRHPYHK